MYDEIKAKLDEEIMDQLSVLSDMDAGSDKRKTAVDDLVKLYRLRIEETKNDRDFIEGVNAREREEQFKKEQIVDQVKERKFRFGMAAAELLIPLIFYASMFYSGLDFEKEGTFTSNMLRNLISRLKPTKK